MKPKYKKFTRIIIFLLLLILLLGSLFAYAEEEIDYEIYDESTESTNFSRPSHFEVKIKNSRIAGGLLDGEIFEIKEGQNPKKSFEKIAEIVEENVKETKKYNLSFSLNFDARAWSITGEYEYKEEVITDSKVPDNFLDLYPDGEKNEYIRRSYSGPILGMLTVSNNNGFDMGNISFKFPEQPPWPEIFYEHDDGSTSTTNLDSQSNGSAGTLQFEITKVFETLEDGSQAVIVDTDASESAGETNTSIPMAIAIGIAGMIAAVGGAATAFGVSGESNGDTKDQDGESTYKMVVYKDFGDSIRYDKPALSIYARMVEISPQGAEVERLDLTEQIRISSQDSHMKIGTPTIAGKYMGATVEAESLKGDQNPSHGLVSFTFTGKGGSFQNNVSFKLVGESYIKFDNQGERLFMEENMILGDNGEYVVPFTLHDFIELPEVTVKAQDNSPFEIKLEKITDFKYEAIIKNTSLKPDKLKLVRAIYGVEVIASTKDEEESNNFRVALYPEGLSVSIIKFDEDGYAQIGAYSDKEAGEGQEEVLATRFKVELAVSEIDQEGRTRVKLLDFSNIKLEIEKIKGTEERTNNLSKVFKYEIEETSTSGLYSFQPKMQIPEGNSKLYLSLPMSCDYNNQKYNLDLPIRLIGEPFNEMKAKKEELELLLKRIKRYMPPEDWTRVINNIKENYNRLSSKEIRLLNKSIYETTARKLLYEAQAEIDFADTLDWVVWGLEWVEWVGKQAFSYLAVVYTGPLGEAIISPAKDIMVGMIAEGIWYREGISSPQQKLQSVNGNAMAMIENSLMTQIDSKTSMKKAGFILASFMVIKTINHYYNDLGPDGKPIGFYDAILAGFADLTVNASKIIVSEKFNELLNNPKAKEYFSKYVGDWVRSLLNANAAGWQKDGAALVSKYLQEFCGASAAKAYSKLSQTDVDIKGGLVVTFNLWDDPENADNSIFVSIDLMEVKDRLFEFIFNDMFAIFPFAVKTIEPPKNPVFYEKDQYI